jgi:Zn-dependent protease with chaperone function
VTYGVWIPLLLPLFAVSAARRLVLVLPGRAAAWLSVTLAVVFGLSSAASLALTVLAGALRLPWVAALVHLSVPLLHQDPQVVLPAAVAAAASLLWSSAALALTVSCQRRELVRARVAQGHGGSGELAVISDPEPSAYALPGRPGRIVVTTGMLHALTPQEREALFAHERAHLTGRHHLFLALERCAATLHPLLGLLREPLAYALERWADESAARVTGDRRLVARAIGRAALAAGAVHRLSSGTRPGSLPAATAGPVPRRVAALLRPAPPRAAGLRARRALAAVLLLCAVLSSASALEAACDLHAVVETAQGEAS